MTPSRESPTRPRLELPKDKVELADQANTTRRGTGHGTTTYVISAAGVTVPIDPYPRQLLLTLLRPQAQIFLPDAFVILRGWHEGKPPKNPLGAFRKVAWVVEKTLTQLPGVEVQITTGGKDQGYWWKLSTNADSNVADAATWLDETTRACRGQDCPEATTNLWHGLPDRLFLLDKSHVAEAILLTASPSCDGLVTPTSRKRVLRSLYGHSLALAGALTALVCLAHAKPKLFRWRHVSYFVRSWVSDLGCVAEAIHATKGTRSLGLPSLSGDDIDEFVSHANAYRYYVLGALSRDSERGMIAEGFRKENGRLEAYAQSGAMVSENEEPDVPTVTQDQLEDKIAGTAFYRCLSADVLRSFRERSARIPDATLHYAVLEELCAWLKRRSRPLMGLPGSLALISPAIHAAVRRNLNGEDPAGNRDAPPGREKLAMTVVSLLDGVSRRGDAERIVSEILHNFAPSGESASDTALPRSAPISDEQLRTLLIEDARHGLVARLGTEDLDAYVPLRLLEQTKSADVEPRATIGPSEPQRLPALWRPFAVERLVPPTTSCLIGAPSGAGKTTFCRRIQWMINRKPDRFAVHIEVDDLRDLAATAQSNLLDRVANRLDPLGRCGGLRRALENALEGRRLVLIIDTRDHLTDPSLRELILRLAHDCHLLVSGWDDALQDAAGMLHFPLLRIEPFDEAGKTQFFGASYDRARTLVREHLEFLSVPMYAYLVRKVAQEDPHASIKSKWDLFTEFMTHVLKKQLAFACESRHGRPLAAEALLQAVAYGAIDRSPARVERIDSEVWSEIVADASALDDAVRTGLVQLVPDPRQKGRHDFVFAHQKLQEYCAAAWACREEKRLHHVLDEYWNPKWREVIKFLAARSGDGLLRRLYSGPAHDNILHSRLFLAAECAGGMPQAQHSADRLLGDITDLIGNLPAAANEAPDESAMVKALVALGTPRARGFAWRLLTATGGAVRAMGIVDDPDVMNQLYSENRMKWVLNSLGDYCSQHIAYRILTVWAQYMPLDYVDGVILALEDRDAFVGHLAAKVIGRVARQLEQRQIDDIVGKIYAPSPRARGAALFALSHLGSQLNQSDISQIIGKLDDWREHTLHNVAGTIEAISEHLDDDHVRDVVEKFWHGGGPVQSAITTLVKKLGQRFSADQIDSFVRGTESPYGRVRERSLEVLRNLGARLTPRQSRSILRCVDDPFVRYDAIRTASSTVTLLEGKQVEQLLKAIYDDDCPGRKAVLDSIPELGPYLDSAHIDAIVECLDVPELQMHAVHACAMCAERLTTAHVWRVLRSLEAPWSRGASDVERGGPLRALGLRTDDEQREYIRKRVSVADGTTSHAWVLRETRAVQYTEDEVEKLRQQYLGVQRGGRHEAYGKLQQLHASGRKI